MNKVSVHWRCDGHQTLLMEDVRVNVEAWRRCLVMHVLMSCR